jgi:hypothetical protein
MSTIFFTSVATAKLPIHGINQLPTQYTRLSANLGFSPTNERISPKNAVEIEIIFSTHQSTSPPAVKASTPSIAPACLLDS